MFVQVIVVLITVEVLVIVANVRKLTVTAQKSESVRALALSEMLLSPL